MPYLPVMPTSKKSSVEEFRTLLPQARKMLTVCMLCHDYKFDTGKFG